MKFRLAIMLACLPLLKSQSPVPQQAQRLALIIANSQYQSLPAIPSANGDADVVAAALQSVGFDVLRADNLTRDRFAAVENQYASKIASGSVCFVYFSGYTVQFEGENFLVATDFSPANTNTLPGHALLRLQQRVHRAGGLLKIFAIESAAEARELQPVSSSRRLGLPDLRNLPQTLVALATQPNDGDSDSSSSAHVFTRALTDSLRQSGLSVIDSFQRVQSLVIEQTKGKQVPFYVQNVTLVWYFRQPIVEPEFRPGQFFTNSKDRQEYVWAPSGTFSMGCVSSTGEGSNCEPQEKESHEVTISKSFWIGRNEVETLAYKRFVSADKSRKMPKTAPFWNRGWREMKDSLPIANVSWQEASAHCQWAGGRLPTEAEWEYSARGGVANAVFPYEGQQGREKANFAGRKGNDRFEDPAPVRKFDPNDWGLFDMSGNVWEWVLDFDDGKGYVQSPVTDPKGPSSGDRHVIRGGSFASDPAKHLRISYRKGSGGPTEAIGFRCVLEDTPEARKLLSVK